MKTKELLAATFIAIALNHSVYAATVENTLPKEGDRREFNGSTKEQATNITDMLDGNYEVVFMQGQLQVYSIAAGQQTGVSVDIAQQLKRLISSGQDDLLLLNFPLSDGKKWNVNYRHQSPGARKPQQRSGSFQVEGMEYVKTTGGAFQSVRIKGTGQTSAGGNLRAWDYFYSPQTKSIVKYFYDSAVGEKSGKVEIELVKFTPGK